MDLQERWECVYEGRSVSTHKDRCVTCLLKHIISYNLFRTAMGNPDPSKVGAFGVGGSTNFSESNSRPSTLQQVFTAYFL